MRVSTALWSLVLGGSVAAIAVGFFSGRTYGGYVLLPVPHPPAAAPAPEPVRERDLTRTLHGPRSLDDAEYDSDPYGDPDRAVAARPAGWAPLRFDPKQQRARIAVVVVDADRAATSLEAFAAEPFPLTVIVAPDTATDTLRAARDAGKGTLVQCAGAEPATIAALLHEGADGIACSTPDAARANALLAAAPRGIIFDDRLDDDVLFRVAHARHRAVVTRDVTVDARDEDGYIDFLFGQAVAIAQRTGVATVAIHARSSSRDNLERFAERAARDGADLVPLKELAAR